MFKMPFIDLPCTENRLCMSNLLQTCTRWPPIAMTGAVCKENAYYRRKNYTFKLMLVCLMAVLMSLFDAFQLLVTNIVEVYITITILYIITII